MFTPHGDFAGQFNNMEGYKYASNASANIVMQARMATMGTGAFMGGSMGAAIGGGMFGRGGAVVGSALGGMAGGYAGGFSDLASVAYGGIASAPVHNQMNAVRVGEMSQRWMTGGTGNASGMGLSHADSMRVAQAMGNFSEQSRGLFNRKDMMNIMQTAGDNGLLEFANNADQIIQTVKTTAKVVLAMSRITGDPDLRNNLRLMGTMQRMGVNQSEFGGLMRQTRGAARMAGVDINSFMANEGMAGAATFQGSGLIGGMGALSALHGAGVARAMVKNGLMSSTELALQGGESGIAQSTAASHAALMNGPGQLITAAMLKSGGGGLDNAAIKKLMSGPVDLNSIIGGAVSNLSSPGAIVDYQMKGDIYKNDLMKKLGPGGMDMLAIRYGQGLQAQYGGEASGMSIGGALHNAGMSKEDAIRYEKLSKSSDYWSSMRNQMEITERGDRQYRASEDKDQRGLWRKELSDGWDRLSISPFGYNSDLDKREELDDQHLAASGIERVRGYTRDASDRDFWRKAGRHRGNLVGGRAEGGPRYGAWNKTKAGLEDAFRETGMDADSATIAGYGEGGVDKLVRGGVDFMTFGIGNIPYRAWDTINHTGGIPAMQRARDAEITRGVHQSAEMVRGGLNMTVDEDSKATGDAQSALGNRAVSGDIRTAMHRALRKHMGTFTGYNESTLKKAGIDSAEEVLNTAVGTGQITQAQADEYRRKGIHKELQSTVNDMSIGNPEMATKLRDVLRADDHIGAIKDKKSLQRSNLITDDAMENSMKRFTGAWNIMGMKTADQTKAIGRLFKKVMEKFGWDPSNPKAMEHARTIIQAVALMSANRPEAWGFLQENFDKEDVKKAKAVWDEISHNDEFKTAISQMANDSIKSYNKGDLKAWTVTGAEVIDQIGQGNIDQTKAEDRRALLRKSGGNVGVDVTDEDKYYKELANTKGPAADIANKLLNTAKGSPERAKLQEQLSELEGTGNGGTYMGESMHGADASRESKTQLRNFDDFVKDLAPSFQTFGSAASKWDAIADKLLANGYLSELRNH
jgi:hypothetical protein